eukprot:3331035-Pleurochrysis_carterae.AAC.5
MSFVPFTGAVRARHELLLSQRVHTPSSRTDPASRVSTRSLSTPQSSSSLSINHSAAGCEVVATV